MIPVPGWLGDGHTVPGWQNDSGPAVFQRMGPRVRMDLYSAYGSPCTSCRGGHFTLPISFGGVALAPRSFSNGCQPAVFQMAMAANPQFFKWLPANPQFFKWVDPVSGYRLIVCGVAHHLGA